MILYIVCAKNNPETKRNDYKIAQDTQLLELVSRGYKLLATCDNLVIALGASLGLASIEARLMEGVTKEVRKAITDRVDVEI